MTEHLLFRLTLCYFTPHDTSPYAILGSPQKKMWNNLLSRTSIPIAIAGTVEINISLERANALIIVTFPKIERCLDFQSSRCFVISGLFISQICFCHNHLYLFPDICLNILPFDFRNRFQNE